MSRRQEGYVLGNGHLSALRNEHDAQVRSEFIPERQCNYQLLRASWEAGFQAVEPIGVSSGHCWSHCGSMRICVCVCVSFLPWAGVWCSWLISQCRL